MQDIVDPLTIEDFEKDAILVISKVEIDSDGAGNFQELPDVKTYNISTNEENRVAKFCSYSFNITCLNIDDRYDPLNSGSSHYNWLKQGRRIKLWAGLEKNEIPYPYQLILGRIDNFKLGKRAGQDICTITGRCLMRMVLDFKLYSPYTYWGTSATYNTVANKIRYDMPADEAGCKGVYRVFLDSTPPYDGFNLEEIYENTDWSYDWHNNQLVFTPRRIPDFPGTNNLKVYYFQEQSVEDVVADILIGSGILQAKIEATTISFLDSDPDTILYSNNNFVTAGFRSGQIITVVTTSGTNDGIYTISTVTPGVITLINLDSLTTEDAATAGTVTITTEVNLVSKTEWLASSSVVATNKKIKRVWFGAGTSALKAITLLSEVVQYRFYFDYAGNPIFKSKPTAGSPVNTISDYEAKIENVEENVDETYTHIIVIGEERDRVLGDDETAPDVPTGLTLSTGLGSPSQASLAWIKAEWNTNTESDFGHYELRIKKGGDSDYTEVSTIATIYMFYGLEPGVTYNVQIRACDIYENRSAWSTVVNKNTATDETIPAQVAGVTVATLLCGIKVNWDGNTEDNIAGYIIERQESPDNVDWTGAWVEKARIFGTLWLDLLLTYSKWYRYRVTAYTQTGVNGTISAISTALQPNKAGTNDIVANAITADLIAANSIYTNAIQAGAITADKIAANIITAAQIAANTITGNEITGTTLSGIFVDAGTITAGIIDGAELRIGGSGSNQEIYFKDSAVWMYDYVSGTMKRIGFKHSTLTFAELFHNTDGYTNLKLHTAGHSAGLYLRNSDGVAYLEAGSQVIGLFPSGQMVIESAATAPTTNLYHAEMMFDQEGADSKLHVYTTEWRHIGSVSGW